MVDLSSFVGASAVALSMCYVCLSIGNPCSIQAFNGKVLESIRSNCGHFVVLEWVDTKMWSLIFISWCLVVLYQLTSSFRKQQKPSGNAGEAISSIGHIHWLYNFFAVLGMFAHVNWVRHVKAGDIGGGLTVVSIGFLLLATALMIVLYSLYKKTGDLQKRGLKFDLYSMRLIVINATDFLCTYTLFHNLMVLDTYLISVQGFSAEDSNFYLMAFLVYMQVVNLYTDLKYFNYLTRYLAGGYITLFTGSLGVMLYQMVSLPHLPMMTLLNFLISVICPLYKIHKQENENERSENKEKKTK